ncbi:ATP-binding cassette transporter snq2, partial [Teratosphaeriaceae sp. CCFEE 6253]
MWGSGPDERLRRQESGAANQWHTVGDRELGADRIHQPVHPTEDVEDYSPDGTTRRQSGTWGEQDVGGFDEDEARANYETLRRELTELGRVRSKDTQKAKLHRTVSGASRR